MVLQVFTLLAIVALNDSMKFHNAMPVGDTGGTAAADLQVIDFEYSGYNPRAFDIANHFCEVSAL